MFRTYTHCNEDSGNTAAFGAGVLSSVLAVFEAARTLGIDEFESIAIRQLGALVGFDGAVWGAGLVSVNSPLSLSIGRASVIDRAPTLLREYGEIVSMDPVTAHFLARPEEASAVSVADYTRAAAVAPIGEYLHRHRIAHLLLIGAYCRGAMSRSPVRRWVTAYRETGAPFAAKEVTGLRQLLPLWTQAHAICTSLHLGRLGRRLEVAEPAFALCDRAGLVHATEDRFRSLTALQEGDAIDGASLAQLVVRGGSAVICSGVVVTAQPAGSWLLLHAIEPGPSAVLSRRELQVAHRYVGGASYKEIALSLGLSPSTIRTQLQSVYQKLGVHSRTELLRAIRISTIDFAKLSE